MFERFTDGARRVVVLAQEEARYLNHPYIGTEHLLLALLAEGESPAALVLADLGYEREAVRVGVEQIVGVGVGLEPGDGPVPFSLRSKKVLELSLRESLELADPVIGPEHLLLGLLREGEGVAAQILTADGRTLEAIRRGVLDLMGAPPASLTARFTAGPPPGTTPIEEMLTNLDRRLEAMEIRLSALEDRFDS